MTYNPQIPSQEKCCYRVLTRLRPIQTTVLDKLPTASAARFESASKGGAESFHSVEFENTVVADPNSGADDEAMMLSLPTFEESIQLNESVKDVLEEHKSKCSDLYALNMVKVRKCTKTTRARIASYKWRRYKIDAVQCPTFSW
ncbi:Orf129 [Heliothis zea nudivirus]|uniref:Uncharacterized protein n=2 Tax=Betanudivirus hezeae TaxID=3052000 RepID=G9I046_HZNV2|nr:Orf129 [Heliothis zea nudivirus]YP_004956768.1 orf20 gene product [Helicoverpa zea nudivirus 2]AAN04422.1 Orf129 [Heliothis zea nudivirus]AEW69569.1 hypothetical protein z2V020 [Helicoverpa zea nudivirus 2]WCZ68500.1 hypothetical protein [Heliothis virescens nudivirus]